MAEYKIEDFSDAANAVIKEQAEDYVEVVKQRDKLLECIKKASKEADKAIDYFINHDLQPCESTAWMMNIKSILEEVLKESKESD